MCSTNIAFKELDLCNNGEACVGPNTPDKAKSFSSADFCVRGGLEILHQEAN